MASEKYEDPTETVPVPTPPLCTIINCQDCDKCTAIALWTKNYHETVDDLLLKSNVHTCTTNINKIILGLTKVFVASLDLTIRNMK